MTTDFNALAEAEIERHARQWEKTEERLHAQISKLQDQVLELQLQAASNEGDVPWFIKDFNALYRVANAFVQRMHGVQDQAAQNALTALTRQLGRLAPAFEVTERIRKPETGGQ